MTIRRTLSIATLIASCTACLAVQAQPSVSPDSVLLVRDGSSGRTGYVLPRHAAEYFRDLYYYAQALEVQIDTLSHVAAVGQEQVALRETQLRLLQSIHRDLTAQIATFEYDLEELRKVLQETDAARQRERRRRHRWRTATFLLAGSTAALAFVVAL